tara:strand:+ start:1823 stop:2857 length:1035 start_codon:yes stop_codon:yes gene_type:complete
MLSVKELEEIRVELENSQNPLFLFDNDVDGLCSFLILRRSIDRGRGVAIKSFPDLKEQYLKKVDELNPDLVVILDKAEVSEEFIVGCKEKNLPIIWIDHHKTKTSKKLIDKTSYYNSFPSSEPTTYIAQKVFNRKEDLWLAMIGCINDVYRPEFAKEFAKDFPELFNENLSPFDALHNTEIGKIALMLNFGLMDSTTNVVNLIKYLFKARSSYDILEENRYNKNLHEKFSELKKFYNTQIEKAERKLDKSSPILFFSYSGSTSMSSQIANKLCYLHKDKLIVVAYKRPEKVNISIRGKNALEITEKITEKINGSTGGGHKEATGAMVPIDQFDNFKKLVIEIAS